MRVGARPSNNGRRRLLVGVAGLGAAVALVVAFGGSLIGVDPQTGGRNVLVSRVFERLRDASRASRKVEAAELLASLTELARALGHRHPRTRHIVNEVFA